MFVLTSPRAQGEQMSDDASPSSSPTAMQHSIPADRLARGKCPLDPPPDLLERRGGGPVQPLPLANGALAWLVTGFDEARTVLADPRFSADKMRHRDATSLQPHEVDAAAGNVSAEPPAARE